MPRPNHTHDHQHLNRGAKIQIERFRAHPVEYEGQPFERPSYWMALVERVRAVLCHPMTPREFVRALGRVGLRGGRLTNVLAAGDGVTWVWSGEGRWIPIARRP